MDNKIYENFTSVLSEPPLKATNQEVGNLRTTLWVLRMPFLTDSCHDSGLRTPRTILASGYISIKS